MRGILMAVFVVIATAETESSSAAELNFRGRLHIDHAFHDADVRALDDDGRVRRGRLGVYGNLGAGFSYLAEYDFAGWDATPKDIYLRYGGWRNIDFTLGHFKAPFSLDNLTSSNSIPFIERALPATTFGFAERTGFSMAGGGKDYRINITLFDRGFGSTGRSDSGDGNIADDGTGLALRMVRVMGRGEDSLWHLGVALSSEKPDNQDDRPVRFRTRPESRPSELRFVDTGNLRELDHIDQAAVEVAGTNRSWWWQGEYMVSSLKSPAGNSIALEGGYVSVGWILTGETRPYSGGVFKGIKPDSRSGAWELAARVSRVDLDDGGFEGGKQTNVTLGVNWYPRSNLRFMANLISVNSRRAGIDDDPMILLLRGQYNFY